MEVVYPFSLATGTCLKRANCDPPVPVSPTVLGRLDEQDAGSGLLVLIQQHFPASSLQEGRLPGTLAPPKSATNQAYHR
jgi:hypothetical protein